MFHSNVQPCTRMLGPLGCGPCTNVGLLMDTAIRTQRGYVPAAQLVHGDELAIFPQGFRAPSVVRGQKVFHTPDNCPMRSLPVTIPALALGIHGKLLLQHETRVLFSDPDLIPTLGTAWVTIRAGDLVGFRDIGFARPEPMQLVIIGFDEDQIITIDDGFRIFVPAQVPSKTASQASSPVQDQVVHLNTRQAQSYLALLECEITHDAKA